MYYILYLINFSIDIYIKYAFFLLNVLFFFFIYNSENIIIQFYIINYQFDILL